MAKQADEDFLEISYAAFAAQADYKFAKAVDLAVTHLLTVLAHMNGCDKLRTLSALEAIVEYVDNGVCSGTIILPQAAAPDVVH